MAACSATVPDKNTSGDNLYEPRVTQEFIDWAWPAYKFKKTEWDEGFGWENVADTDLPLARILNSIWLLNYSAEDYTNEDYNSNALHWACRYVREQINELWARCGDGSAVATTFSDRIELYSLCFYTKDVSGRAETLVHEARHRGGKPHNAKFPAGSTFGAGKNGADANWDYEGAWMYGALYLWWFYADGRRTTTALREAAKQRGNVVIDNAFATHPGFTIV
ncbi:hypothetical protein [Streptomyces sp. NBC_00576]|uniref:hypothetical protein n=1 Tax=Streptomyces sp. NBC_00576 TaxID=2903665 RepID=UPI002E8061D0|nr:hypothetical protein [Streptomyces sp. NBC_00576]WUB70039.1 hypothetical protein OG734_08115 [Streptomyces sp. NBC_00576]